MPVSPPMGGPGGGIVSAQSPPFELPIRYMLLGIFGFVVYAVDLVAQSLNLAAGEPSLPSVVALTHLLTLGSLLAFVMGAVYQLSTVAFLIPIRMLRWARFNFWLYAVSITGLIASMATWWSSGLILFGTLATVSVCLYASIMIASLCKTNIKGAMLNFVTAAHVYLILAILVAWLLVLATRVTALDMPQLLATHILLAVGGFFTFLIMGLTFKLLPMFTLSHGFSTAREKWTLACCHGALWSALCGVWTWRVLFWLAAVLAVAAFVNQLFHIRGILKKRMRKRIEPPIRTVISAAVGGVIGICVLAVQLVLARGMIGWQSVVTFYLLGWITFTVMGYAYKIVPFLVWSRRYSKRAGQGKVPLIADLVNLKLSKPVFVTFAVGVVVLTLSASIPWGPGAIAGTVVIAAAVLAFTIQMFAVIDIREVGKELKVRD